MDAAERRAIIEDCRDLVIALVHLDDHREYDRAVDELWMPDATWLRGGKLYTGREQIRASFDRATPTTVMRHLVVNTHVTVIDRDHAEGVSYYITYQNDPGTTAPRFPLPLEAPFSMGEWHDKYVRTPAGWRFAAREVKRLFQKPGS